MMRALALLPTGLVLFLLLAPAALATQEPISGEGTYGPADDKVVTNTGFIVILLFPLFILCMSLLQWRLDKRKEAAQGDRQEARRRPSLAVRLVGTAPGRTGIGKAVSLIALSAGPPARGCRARVRP